MIRSDRQRNGVRGPSVRCRLAAACAAVALAVGSSVCAAGDGGNTEKHSSDRHIAPNHGAVLAEGVSPVAAAVQQADNTAPGLETGGTEAGARQRATPSAPVPSRVRSGRLPRELLTKTDSSSLPWYRRGFGALAIALAVIAAIAWAVRRWLPAARTGDSTLLRVVARTNLSPKHGVALIHLGNRFVMVGMSGDRVTTLCEINQQDEVALLAARCGVAQKRGGGEFNELLSSERTDYDVNREEDVAASRQAQTASGSTPRPLKDLLRRIRALQST